VSEVGRSYAQAFLAAAPAGYDTDGFLDRAGAIGRALLSEPRLKAFFAAPAVPGELKRKALEDLAGKAGLDGFGRRFFQVLLAHRRLTDLPQILRALRDAADRARGIVEARVTVAEALEEAQRNQIAQALALAVGRRVRLTAEVDEKILGGFIARVGSEVFDASVLNAVHQFQQRASEGAKV